MMGIAGNAKKPTILVHPCSLPFGVELVKWPKIQGVAFASMSLWPKWEIAQTTMDPTSAHWPTSGLGFHSTDLGNYNQNVLRAQFTIYPI